MRAWSWKIGEFRGIGVYVHATFLILLAFVALAHWSEDQSVAKTIEGVLFIIALFACVVLHEFGHALTAAQYGIRTRDITLLPIGGVARLEHMPDDPWQELWVALAGPAVNVVIAGVLFVWLLVTSHIEPLAKLSVTSGSFVTRLMVVNLFLVVFNLLPAFPMDGGRVLRALLATRMEYTRATNIAAGVGQAMALLFGFVGFFTNPMLMFIALFVWIGATQEAGMVQIKSALGGIPVRRAMITEFHSIEPQAPLARAIEFTMAGSQRDFPVVEQGRVVGILTQSDLLKGLTSHGAPSTVAESMTRQFETVEAGEMLETAFQRLQQCQCHTVPVLYRGDLVGLVTMDNIGEFIAIQTATGRRGPGQVS